MKKAHNEKLPNKRRERNMKENDDEKKCSSSDETTTITMERTIENDSIEIDLKKYDLTGNENGGRKVDEYKILLSEEDGEETKFIRYCLIIGRRWGGNEADHRKKMGRR